MVRSAALAAAAVSLLLGGCSGASFGPTGGSMRSDNDGVQTVSDAADALDLHRPSASDNAKAAIGAIDALGSFVRDIAEAEHMLTSSSRHGNPREIHQRVAARHGTHVVSGSDLVMQPGFASVTEFCQSSAGYSPTGIPSLDVAFGWQSGAFSGGVRAFDERGGFATWSAHAGGEVVQGAIGALSLRRGAGSTACPITRAAFAVAGADVASAFSIPITLTFRHGQLSNVTVMHATFANGESLDVTTAANRQPVETSGIIRKGRTQVASFGTNAAGEGTLTITSTGAQYVISDWIVVGT